MDLNEIMNLSHAELRAFLLEYPNPEFPVYTERSVNEQSDIHGLRDEVAAIHGHLIGAYTV